LCWKNFRTSGWGRIRKRSARRPLDDDVGDLLGLEHGARGLDDRRRGAPDAVALLLARVEQRRVDPIGHRQLTRTPWSP
jgi:hypothetical protein